MVVISILFISGLLAWCFGTIAAGGAATIMIPIMGLIIGIEAAIPAIAVASILANPSRVFLFFRYIDWSIAKWLIPGTLIGGVLGSYSFTLLPIATLQILIGLFLIYLAYPIVNPLSFIPFSLKGFFPLGVFVSFLSGIMGGSGPLLNPFFIHFGSAKESIVATKSLNSLIMQVAKITVYGITGFLMNQALIAGVAVGLGAIIGIAIGKNHLIKINEKQFKRYTSWLLIIAGSVLLYKGLAY